LTHFPASEVNFVKSNSRVLGFKPKKIRRKTMYVKKVGMRAYSEEIQGK
jgi:hypothetical protein